MKKIKIMERLEKNGYHIIRKHEELDYIVEGDIVDGRDRLLGHITDSIPAFLKRLFPNSGKVVLYRNHDTGGSLERTLAGERIPYEAIHCLLMG